DRPGDKRLAAYTVAAPRPDGGAPTVGELRAHLQERLPDYMVPPIFIALDEMPLTPNGKVDRKSLPAPDRNRPELGEEYVPPRNPTEAALVAIWSEVLGLERIGVNDDFFELGGDSLMVIKVVAKANKEGHRVTTKQLFQNRTVAELAAVAGTSEILAEQGLVRGETPFTPAQLHFLELGHPNPGWHSLGALLELDTALDAAAVEEAMRLLLLQHDNLRVRLEGEGAGRRLVTDGEPERVELHRLDLAGLDEEERRVRIRDTVFELTKSFDLARGPLFHGAILDQGPGLSKLVFLNVHFLAADVGSWHTLLDDFDTYYRHLARGEEPPRQPKTTAARQWAERLAQRAHGPEIRSEVPFWLSDERRRATPIPADFPEGENLFETAANVQSKFSVDETRGLLLEIPRKYGVQIDGLLLTAVLAGFERWTGGGRTFLVDLLGHGREALYDDTDLTRTVGWLNTIFPVALTLDDPEDLEGSLRSVNRQIRSIPHGGLGYGVLRYLSEDPDVAARMRAMPAPGVFFNYFGPDNEEQLATFRKASHWGGYVLDKGTRRLRPLAIGVYIQHDRMTVKWEYSTALHRRETIEAFVSRAEEVLRHFLAAVGRGEARPARELAEMSA
ncbi:MAG TPA: condensation domain-containing protein, partial [Thermoanaerobaculia bacterium]